MYDFVLFQQILEEMTTKGIEPNASFDAAMVVAHCALDDVEKAMTVLEEMRVDGVPANHQVFHALIREGAWSESWKIVKFRHLSCVVGNKYSNVLMQRPTLIHGNAGRLARRETSKPPSSSSRS